MATRLVMPKLGMAMAEGVVAEWVRDDGSAVEKDDVIAVVESEKITYELRAPQAGILHRRAPQQQMLPVGAVIGYIAAPGEAVPEAAPATPAPPRAVAAVATAAPAAPAAAAQGGTFVLATPMAKRLAREHGVALEAIAGSGPGGRVQEQDVLAFVARQAPPPAPRGVPVAQTLPFAGMRRTIAQHVVASLHTMAQVTITTEADVTAFVEVYERLKRAHEVSATSLLVALTAATLRRHPRLNATLAGDELRLLAEVNVGVAVALDDGLIVPVIHHADQRAVVEIDRDVKRLSAAARAGSLTLDDVSGGTFTITNLGMYGVDAFTPIINGGEVAILGVGRIQEKPAVYRGAIVARRLMTLSLTFDHRLVDGAPAAAFLQSLRELLEDPAGALGEGDR